MVPAEVLDVSVLQPMLQPVTVTNVAVRNCRRLMVGWRKDSLDRGLRAPGSKGVIVYCFVHNKKGPILFAGWTPVFADDGRKSPSPGSQRP